MKTNSFPVAAILIALALIFSGCGDSGGGSDETPTILGGELDDKLLNSDEPMAGGDEPVAGSDEPVAGGEPDNGLIKEVSSSSEEKEASSSSSEIALLPSSSSGPDLCAGFVEGTKREHYGKEKKQFCDKRDGKRYVYVTLGNLTWMAENLNHETESSVCAKNVPNNCETYGRLYDWQEASTICPADWHLPDLDEWKDLKGFILYDISSPEKNGKLALQLMSVGFGDGTDKYGFTALPGGRQFGTDFQAGAAFWMSTEYSSSNAFQTTFTTSAPSLEFQLYDPNKNFGSQVKTQQASVRCVKDVKDEVEQIAYGPTCEGRPQNYDSKLYECRPGKNGVYLKGDVHYEGETYEAVLIGAQTWMAKNLNYAPPAGNSKCGGKDEDCAKYGRLYDWTTAMNYDSRYLTYRKNYSALSKEKGICPVGWHVPSYDEWFTLRMFVSYITLAEDGSESGGEGFKLRAVGEWNEDFAQPLGYNYTSTDEFGFAALPTGVPTHVSGIFQGGDNATWWSTEETGDTRVKTSLQLIRNEPYFVDGSSDKRNFLPVRCLKDSSF